MTRVIRTISAVGVLLIAAATALGPARAQDRQAVPRDGGDKQT